MKQKGIKPHHLFRHQDSWYVINIEEMSADPIDEKTAGALVAIAEDPDLNLSPGVKEQLEALGLLSPEREKDPKAAVETQRESVPPIISMTLLLTQSCNLRCVYCYGEGGEYGTGGEMEEETAFQAVDWLLEQSGKMKKLYIGFFGGEPFLNFSLMKAVVEYAEERLRAAGKEICFHTTTNGTLLDDEKIAFIKEHRLMVMISFDGPKEIQDAQRPFASGEGTYDLTLPKIKKLLAVRPETPGHAVIVGDTDPRIVKAALKDIGFAEVSILPASQSLFADEPGKKKAERDLGSLLQELEKEAENWVSLTKSRDNGALKNLTDGSALFLGLKALLHNSKRHHACGAGRGLVGVSSVGDIYLCHRFVGMEEYKLGSVFEKGLDRDAYLKSPTSGGICGDCFAKYHCAGGCKHDNAGSCGSVFVPSAEMCRLRCRELELAAVVACRLTPEDKAFLVEQEIFPPKPCPFDF